jgi:hypothetical protein
MDTPDLNPEIHATISEAWRLAYQPAGCPKCGRAFLVPPEWLGRLCPYCFAGGLEAQPARLRQEPPERVLPFQPPAGDWPTVFQKFTREVWLAPDDFTPLALQQRLISLYWPVWLVDGNLSGEWQAEIGYDYQVKSSRENYATGGWHSQEVIETRIRWEPRLGQMVRHYDNRLAPALSDQNQLTGLIGPSPLTQAVPYDPAYLQGAALRIPDLPPAEAWTQAQPAFEQAAQVECQQAAGGQHARGFKVRANYTELNWTQLLVPLYISYYTDDKGHPIPVYINGVTHQMNGKRLASPRKGLRLAAIVLAAALILCLLAVIFYLLGLNLFPQVRGVSSFFWALGIITAALAVIPAAWPLMWNQSQP